MALVTCPDCGTQISGEAPTCPNCGRPNKATTIRSRAESTPIEKWGCKYPFFLIIALLVIFIIILALIRLF